jgi:hypothetical protein
MPECRNCKHYVNVENTRHGYCRSEKSYYFNLLRYGGNRAAARCFEEMQTESNEKIKPCPCCGSKAKVFQDYHNNSLVQCVVCGLGTLHCHDEAVAIKAWNKRVKGA